MAALIAALLSASLTARPGRLVLGKDSASTLEIAAPAGAKVTFSASVGTVGPAKRDGEVVRARYTPPSLRAPAVALILAQIDRGDSRELSWAALPLAGADTMEIETRPGSKVVADVGGQSIGPVTADKSGTAKLPMVVPPGVATATLRITDPFGNTTDKPLDLEPPPFTRVRAAARTATVVRGDDVELEVFVVRPDGTPDDDAKVRVRPSGDVEQRIGPGTYLVTFPAPAEGPAKATVEVGGQEASAEVPVVAGTPRRTSWWRSGADARKDGALSLGVLAGGGAAWDGSGMGSALVEGAVRVGRSPLEIALQAGGSLFADRAEGFGTVVRASPHTWILQAGVRGTAGLSPRIGAYLSLLAGVQQQIVDFRKPGGSTSAWSPRGAAALGLSASIGPGRVMTQLQFETATSNVAGLSGALGGVQVLAGYLFAVR